MNKNISVKYDELAEVELLLLADVRYRSMIWVSIFYSQYYIAFINELVLSRWNNIDIFTIRPRACWLATSSW